MRPYLAHLCILAALMVLGIASFVAEALFSETSGIIFKKYDATRLYWLVFMGYAIISTAIVSTVYIFHRLIRKVFTKKAVILSHVLPIGLVWLLIELNVHDIIQNAWQRSANKGSVTGQQPAQDALKQKPQIPQAPLLKPSLYRAPTNTPLEQQEQTVNRDTRGPLKGAEE
jgi:hypothetical protein